jgi:hypothetical protein
MKRLLMKKLLIINYGLHPARLKVAIRGIEGFQAGRSQACGIDMLVPDVQHTVATAFSNAR